MQIEDPRPRLGVLVAVFLILVGLAALPFLFLRPRQTLPPYVVQNFVGKVEVYSSERKTWAPPQRGQTIGPAERIRTAEDSEIDIQVPDQIRIRLKANSEAEIPRPNLFDRQLRYRLRLLRGNLLGATQKQFEGETLEVSTPTLVAAVLGTAFRMEVKPETKESTFQVLSGSVEVTSVRNPKTVVVKALEKTEVKAGAQPTPPTAITRQEWSQLKEAYELLQKSAALEAKQLDLSKEAGNLFQYVFDHGSFFTPNFGYAGREFFKDPSSGTVHLEIEYDVFPTGSFAGMYLKTRDLDIAKFQALKFEARIDPDKGFPESFKIEMKSGGGLVRTFVARDFKGKWQPVQFPLRFSRTTPLTEIAFVFSNEKAGAYKKGYVQLRDVTLEPLPPLPAVTPSKPAKPSNVPPRPASVP